MVRGIDRGVIFEDDIDRDRFIDRLSHILSETATSCYAWALIPNHFHLLLKTGTMPVSHVMQKLLTGYAVSFNRRHTRSGHLFQNRYKSILCQEEPYLLELMRYIHLNPIRASIVSSISELDQYPYCGHGTLMGSYNHDWQDTKGVLRLFSDKIHIARNRYRNFLSKGLFLDNKNGFTGGGLIRSSGGWKQVISDRRDKVFQKSDERILGDGEFVDRVLLHAKEEKERRYSLMAAGIDLDAVARRVCEVLHAEMEDLFGAGKNPDRVRARSLYCYWAVRELGVSQTELARQFSLSPAALTKTVRRGEALAKEREYTLL
jgi:REP element-mobilizing transposase RayT